MTPQKFHLVYNQKRRKYSIVIPIVDSMHITVSPYIQNIQKSFAWTEQKLHNAYKHTTAASFHLCTSLAAKWELEVSLKREERG
jgi:hypothetical protein